MEKWVTIPGYEGYYQVSNLCRIKSLKRVIKGGHGTRTVNERILKQGKDTMGYIQILLRKKGVTKRHSVHRLMAILFIPNPLKFKTVNHKDGNKQNNSLENLEWCTLQDNLLHAFNTGLKSRAKLKIMGQAAAMKLRKPICQMNGEEVIYESILSASKTTHIPISNIVEVLKGRRKTAGGYQWKYI